MGVKKQQMHRYTEYVGVDVGKSGAICVMREEGVEAHKMPHTFLEAQDLIASLKLIKPVFLVEKTNSRPGDGAMSAFKFGRSCQMIEDAILAAKYPMNLISPQKWQKDYNVPRGMEYDARKKWLKNKAQELFPELRATLWNADALLIVDYCYKHYR
jgi:hypothetical protein